MKIENKKVNNTIEFTIELDKKEITPILEQAVADKIANLEADGFRKGKMPQAMFIKKYGIESTYPDAIDLILNEYYPKFVEKESLDVIASPELDWATLEIDKDKGFKVSGTVEVMPEIKIEGYKEVSEKIKKGTAKVTKKDIDAEINNLMDHKSIIEVKEGKAVDGDIVVIDFEGFKDGVAFDGGKGESYPLTIGSNSFIPGFEEQLIGCQAGDEKEVEVTFPEDYHAEDLKGAAVNFKCLVHDVKEKKVPKLTDEIAQEFKQFEVKTVEELKAAIEKQLTEKKETEVKNKYHQDVMDKLIKLAKVEAPKVMIAQETDYTIQNFKQQIAQQGMEFEMYIQMMGMTEDTLKEQINVDSKRKIEEMLVMEAIVKAEDFKVTKEEINAKIKEIAEANEMTQKAVKEAIGDVSRLERDMKFDKAYKLVLGE